MSIGCDVVRTEILRRNVVTMLKRSACDVHGCVCIGVATRVSGTLAVSARFSLVQHIRQLLTHLGTLAAHPSAFLIVAVYAVSWMALSPDTLDWHGATTLVVWCMTLLIQRAEHRDTQAIHAKLDELLSADARARSEVAHVDDKEPEEIERFRERERASGRGDDSGRRTGSREASN
jgi:low affinity Fe/Cu permease